VADEVVHYVVDSSAAAAAVAALVLRTDDGGCRWRMRGDSKTVGRVA